MGSAPNVAATAHVSHPVKQGLIQALGVFTDTLIICTCTAFIILFSGAPLDGSINGVQLTQQALSNEVGSIGSTFVALAILLFAFSSIIVITITEKQYSFYHVQEKCLIYLSYISRWNGHVRCVG